MMSMEPLNAVKPNQSMYDLARCWARNPVKLALPVMNESNAMMAFGQNAARMDTIRPGIHPAITYRLRCSRPWSQKNMSI